MNLEKGRCLLIVSIITVGIAFLIGCQSRRMTDEFFGLRLNEQYTPIAAIDILRQNTGKVFSVISDSPYEIVGHDISFAGQIWENVFYSFDFKGHLREVHFEHHYFAPEDIGSWGEVEKEAKGIYFRMLKSLEVKYGENNNGPWHRKQWRFGKKWVAVSMSVLFDTGTIYNRGKVDVGSVYLIYHDDNADATSIDVL